VSSVGGRGYGFEFFFFFFFFFVSSAMVVGLIYLNLWCFSSLTAWGELSCLKCENNY
jgi:hypothetical protein